MEDSDAPEVASLPEHWLSNSVRFHFPESAGFARIARSLMVRPWIWSDTIEPTFWYAAFDEADKFPVAAPIHTVAAAIESNLLYSDMAGFGQERLDRRLLTEMRRINDAVVQFRTVNEARRRSRRQALMEQWSTVTPKTK